MTYDQLRQAIQTTAANNDPEFQEQIDNFIIQAESLIYQSVRLPKFSTTATLNILAGIPTLAAPQDFLSADSLTIGAPLLKKDPEFIYEVFTPGSSGRPRFYAMLDDLTILLGPTPDNAYAALLRYFNKPVSIVGQAAETYISNRFPAALLNGALMFAAVFMKDQDMQAAHEQIFYSSLGLAKKFKDKDATKQTFEKTSAAVATGDEI